MHIDTEVHDGREAEVQERQDVHNDYSGPSIAKFDSQHSNTMHETHDQALDHQVSPSQEPEKAVRNDKQVMPRKTPCELKNTNQE